MRIAVASGKGGTGKTLVSTNLTQFFTETGSPVTYLDTDAEAPNGHLFLKPKIEMEIRFKVSVPLHDMSPCAGHERCQKICAFGAIISVNGNVVVFPELCHGCGACLLACPSQSLLEGRREIGTISVGYSGKVEFLSGRLDIGEARVAPLIQELTRLVKDKFGIVLIDAPPGASCGAIAAVRSADLLLLVTEPTPFGLHDLNISVEMGRELGLRLAAVINKSDLGDNRVKEFLHHEGIPILAEIPFDRALAKAYSAAHLAIETCSSFKKIVWKLGDRLMEEAGGIQ